MNRIPGVVTGVVESVDDPQGEGRIRVSFRWLEGEPQSTWAPVVTPFAGNDRGAWWMPEVGDECLIAFEYGDFNHPFVLGFLWNGVDSPPESNHRVRLFKSLNGHKIEIADPDPAAGDNGYLLVEDAHGNSVLMANAYVRIKSTGVLHIEAPAVTINQRPVAPVGNPI